MFEYGLREQGCSGIELQRALHDAGFRLYLAPPGVGVPPVSADVLHNANSPYNLYCFAQRPFAGTREAPRAVQPGRWERLYHRRDTNPPPFT